MAFARWIYDKLSLKSRAKEYARALIRATRKIYYCDSITTRQTGSIKLLISKAIKIPNDIDNITL